MVVALLQRRALVGPGFRDEDVPVCILVPVFELVVQLVVAVDGIEPHGHQRQEGGLGGDGLLVGIVRHPAIDAVQAVDAGLQEHDRVVEEAQHLGIPPHGEVGGHLPGGVGGMTGVFAGCTGAPEFAQAGGHFEGVGQCFQGIERLGRGVDHRLVVDTLLPVELLQVLPESRLIHQVGREAAPVGDEFPVGVVFQQAGFHAPDGIHEGLEAVAGNDAAHDGVAGHVGRHEINGERHRRLPHPAEAVQRAHQPVLARPAETRQGPVQERVGHLVELRLAVPEHRHHVVALRRLARQPELHQAVLLREGLLHHRDHALHGFGHLPQADRRGAEPQGTVHGVSHLVLVDGDRLLVLGDAHHEATAAAHLVGHVGDLHPGVVADRRGHQHGGILDHVAQNVVQVAGAAGQRLDAVPVALDTGLLPGRPFLADAVEGQVLAALPEFAALGIDDPEPLGEIEDGLVPLLVLVEGPAEGRRLQVHHGVDLSPREQLLSALLHQLLGRAADRVEGPLVDVAGHRVQNLLQALPLEGETAIRLHHRAADGQRAFDHRIGAASEAGLLVGAHRADLPGQLAFHAVDALEVVGHRLAELAEDAIQDLVEVPGRADLGLCAGKRVLLEPGVHVVARLLDGRAILGFLDEALEPAIEGRCRLLGLGVLGQVQPHELGEALVELAGVIGHGPQLVAHRLGGLLAGGPLLPDLGNPVIQQVGDLMRRGLQVGLALDPNRLLLGQVEAHAAFSFHPPLV